MSDELRSALFDALTAPVMNPSDPAASTPLILTGGSVFCGCTTTHARPSGVLQVPFDLTDDDARSLQRRWSELGTDRARLRSKPDLIRQASRSYEWLTCCPRCGAVTTLDGQGRERCLLCHTDSPAIQRFPYARNFVLPFILAVVLFTSLAVAAGQGWVTGR